MAQNTQRPLSPHLQVYRPQLTTVMSILHRFCGAALAIGTLMVMWMLVAAALGEGAYNVFIWFCGTWLGALMLLGWSVALFYHMCNGVRHLLWDTGRFLSIKGAYRAGYIVMAATVLLTWLAWGGAYMFQLVTFYSGVINGP